MDFHGCGQKSIYVSDYKQVGAFFFQTDGLQMYPGSIVRDVFYHVNDDALKIYSSDVTVSNVIVWKCHNDPIIQLGWKARSVQNVSIDGLSIIHTRYQYPHMYVPSAIIGASPSYDGHGQVRPDYRIEMNISNIVCEGPSPSLIRITPLQSYRLNIRNVALPDGFVDDRRDDGLGVSIVEPSHHDIKMQIEISNWTIKGEQVTMENFHSHKLGRFNIDGSYWGHWRIN
eukprot:TRINITY_DN114250_c0_g1_i1.p1 TRINITY_DN114250_c0_g1~~TRINITY_DN114250_c0_g1_i1.p1  ORF type:complete len:254 (-),score=6.17 TRINITY_DN114250_c0_g1_i1:342-1025(-)